MKILKVDTEKRRIGTLGEKYAVKYLKKQGYKILEKNFVADGNEIDIIATKKDILAFVEVKTRTIGTDNPYEPRPASAVMSGKQKKIIKTAKLYSSAHPEKSKEKLHRLDIIEVYLEKGKANTINHMESAFTKNTAKKYYKI